MLNQRIKTLRTARGLSQVELGKKLGVSKQSVSNWENDNIQPSVDMLIRIARFFGTSTDYLLGIENGKTIDVSSLTHTQVEHLKLIISDIQGNKE